MEGIRVVLNDCANRPRDFLVHPKVLTQLEVLPGAVVECICDQSCFVKIWPKAELGLQVAECGRLLLAQMGASLGGSVVLKAPSSALQKTKKIFLESEKSNLKKLVKDVDDFEYLRWNWVSACFSSLRIFSQNYILERANYLQWLHFDCVSWW